MILVNIAKNVINNSAHSLMTERTYKMRYVDTDGHPFDVLVRTTADQLSTPVDQLGRQIDIIRNLGWPVTYDDLDRIVAEMRHLPQVKAPEAIVLVMTFSSATETFERYAEALGKQVELHLRQELDPSSIRSYLHLNPVCAQPKPGLAWWRINPDAHMPSLQDEVQYRRYGGEGSWSTFNRKCFAVAGLGRSDLAHASVLAMALMHPAWLAADGRMNRVRMGGYLFSRKPNDPSAVSCVELNRGSTDSSGRRLYGLDLIWSGNGPESPIPTAEPIRFSR